MKIIILLGWLLCIVAAIAPVQAAPKVAVSIPPIHSLVEGLMQGIAKPDLLITANQSPHNTSLAPSTLKQVHAADLIIWVGPTLETALSKPLSQIRPTKKITLLGVDAIEKLPTRVGKNFDAHDHEHDDEHDDDHNEQQDHAQESLIDHTTDPHLWLSPHNAEAIVQVVSTWLIKNDPENAQQYKTNTTQLRAQIDTLHDDLKQQLQPIQSQQKKWIVFHDAYQYFEHEFELTPLAAVTLNPDRKPGAKRLQTLRHLIADNNVRCLFIEPQFKPDAVGTIAENTPAKIAILDPIGAEIPPGKDHWFTLLKQLSNNLTQCLSAN